MNGRRASAVGGLKEEETAIDIDRNETAALLELYEAARK
jgi:hypothetical protein